MTKVIIFDMDGTLFQTNQVLEASLEDTFQKLRKINKWEGDAPLAEYQQIMGVPLPKVWETLLPEFTPYERNEVDALFLDRLISHIKNGRGALYPGVKETMGQLTNQGFSVYIASNGLKRYLQTIVEYYRLNSWVTETFSIEQIDSLDKSSLVQEIIRKHNIQEGAVVGDRLSDIRAAKENGLTAVGCRFDFAQEEELAQADHVIEDLRDLKHVLPLLEGTTYP